MNKNEINNLICIVCPNGCALSVKNDNGRITVDGNKCPRGIAFATEEITAPKRSVTTTVATIFPEMPVVPVRTTGDIPKEKIRDLIALANTIVIDKPKYIGEVIVANVFDTKVNLIVTTDMVRVIGSKNG